MVIAPVNLARFPAHDIFNVYLWFNIFPAPKKQFLPWNLLAFKLQLFMCYRLCGWYTKILQFYKKPQIAQCILANSFVIENNNFMQMCSYTVWFIFVQLKSYITSVVPLRFKNNQLYRNDLTPMKMETLGLNYNCSKQIFEPDTCKSKVFFLNNKRWVNHADLSKDK